MELRPIKINNPPTPNNEKCKKQTKKISRASQTGRVRAGSLGARSKLRKWKERWKIIIWLRRRLDKREHGARFAFLRFKNKTKYYQSRKNSENYKNQDDRGTSKRERKVSEAALIDVWWPCRLSKPAACVSCECVETSRPVHNQMRFATRNSIRQLHKRLSLQTFHVRLSISTFAADNDDDRLVIHRYLFVAQSRAVGIITTVCGSRRKESERWRPYKQFNFTAFSSRLAPERLRRNITWTHFSTSSCDRHTRERAPVAVERRH